MMKLWFKRGAATTALLMFGFLALRWLPLDAGPRERPAREVVLVARQMAFFLDGDASARNPRLRFAPGERVRVVLRNEEPGVTHNFAVPAWEITTRELQGSGSAAIEFVVPRTPGLHPYECTPHAAMMRGEIEIGEP